MQTAENQSRTEEARQVQVVSDDGGLTCPPTVEVETRWTKLTSIGKRADSDGTEEARQDLGRISSWIVIG